MRKLAHGLGGDGLTSSRARLILLQWCYWIRIYWMVQDSVLRRGERNEGHGRTPGDQSLNTHRKRGGCWSASSLHHQAHLTLAKFGSSIIYYSPEAGPNSRKESVRLWPKILLCREVSIWLFARLWRAWEGVGVYLHQYG